MLLSVVIPVYNNASALMRCLRSFLDAGNALSDVEIVIVDDGSDSPIMQDDGVRALCQKLPHLAGTRTPNLGAAAARNTGAALAVGKYLWFFDADDCVEPLSFIKVVQLLKDESLGISVLHTGPMRDLSSPVRPRGRGHSHTVVCPSGKSHLRKCSLDDLFVPQSACMDHTTYIFLRSLFTDKLSLRYPDRKLLEDAQFVLSLCDSVTAIHCDDTLRPYIRNRNGESITSGAWTSEKSARFIPDICDFFRKYGDFLDRHPEIGRSEACYRRLRYVYMRVLCVKGCPWSLISDFKSCTAGRLPYRSIKEWLFFRTPFGRLTAYFCRKARKTK